MHYFIDGYNLLFRSHPFEDSLQESRLAIIRDLNQKIALVRLNVSIVFDSSLTLEESKSHFDQLEIFYTSKGKTADEYILDKIRNSPTPAQETVVTSDKGLSRQARAYLAKTTTVEAFLNWLDRAYANKLRPPTAAIKKPCVAPKKEASPPSQEVSAHSCETYYAHVFELEWQAMLAREEREKKEKAPASSLDTVRKKKQKKRALLAPAEDLVFFATDEERWLTIFEKRWDDML